MAVHYSCICQNHTYIYQNRHFKASSRTVPTAVTPPIRALLSETGLFTGDGFSSREKSAFCTFLHPLAGSPLAIKTRWCHTSSYHIVPTKYSDMHSTTTFVLWDVSQYWGIFLFAVSTHCGTFHTTT